MVKLYTESARLDLFFAAYYTVLLKDSIFCAQLQALLDQLDKDLAPIISRLKERRFGLTSAQRDFVIFGFTQEKTDDPNLNAGINPSALNSSLKPDTVFAACANAARTLDSFIET